MDKGLFKGCTQFILLLLGLILLFVATGHGAITKQAGSKNSIGYEPYYTNPYIYLYGSIASGQLFKDGDRVFTVIVFQPSHTFQLYVEEVIFCGNASAAFNGEAGKPLVVTYERVAHARTNGTGCHVLESVDEVKSKEAQ